jgi:peptidoglycan/xylan/chitin deacetylase (PgdA/CDA1 family)
MRRGWRRPALLALLAALSPGLSCRAVVQWKVRHLAQDNPRETRAHAVALTIDDGPDAATTPEILRVLERNGARATFFIITSRVPGNEELLRRVVAEGHELGNHLVHDEPSLKLPPAEFERQLRESHQVLSPFASLRWFRPGSGQYDARMLATLEAHGYRCALGSVYPFDPQIRWSWFSKRFILSNAKPGSVIILHDWGGKGRRTAKTLSNVLPVLARRGFRVVTLTELEGLRSSPGSVEPARRKASNTSSIPPGW